MPAENFNARFDWNPTTVAQLKALWAQGLSAGDIAREMGAATRNTIIGKVHALGLSGRGRAVPGVARAAPGPKPVRTAVFKPKPSSDRSARDASRAKRQREIDADHLAAGAELRDLPADHSPDAVPYLAREGDTCRWPLNDVVPISEHQVCGSECVTGGVYCGRHARLSYDSAAARRASRGRERQPHKPSALHLRAAG